MTLSPWWWQAYLLRSCPVTQTRSPVVSGPMGVWQMKHALSLNSGP